MRNSRARGADDCWGGGGTTKRVGADKVAGASKVGLAERDGKVCLRCCARAPIVVLQWTRPSSSLNVVVDDSILLLTTRARDAMRCATQCDRNP